MDSVGTVHPIEQLRYVARASGADAGLLVQEAASALGVFRHDRPGLVTAARRLLTRQPTVGPLWWMCSRLTMAADPWAEARAVIEELRADRTDRELARSDAVGGRAASRGGRSEDSHRQRDGFPVATSSV